jgi:hypothetical protein
MTAREDCCLPRSMNRCRGPESVNITQIRPGRTDAPGIATCISESQYGTNSDESSESTSEFLSQGRSDSAVFLLQGTAKSSGQLRNGDMLIKVDGVRVSDENEAQQLLQVPASESTVT